MYISFTSIINEFMYKLLFNKIQSLWERNGISPPQVLFQLHCIWGQNIDESLMRKEVPNNYLEICIII